MSQKTELSHNLYTYNEDRYDYRVSYDSLHSPAQYGKTRVFQLGRIHCHRHTEIPVHPQLNYIELTVATDGRATVYTNGKGVEIVAGDIHVSFAGDFHSITSDSKEPLKYDFISFSTEDVELNSAIEKIIENHHDAASRVIRSRSVVKHLSDAINEMADSDEYTERVMTAILERMTVSLIRAFNSRGREDTITGAGEEELLCLKLMNYIDNHIYTISNLRELESITNYTYNYMSNLFKKVTGDTLANYYRNRRFEAATLLLKSGQFSISQISAMLNYSSIYSFSLAFKKKYGYSPTSVK